MRRALIALIPLAVAAAPAPTSWLRTGTPDMQSAGTLAFTDNGTLIVGDSPGSAIFALDVSALESRIAGGADTAHLRGLDGRVAARLGTVASNIAINDLAVHPRSRAIYLAVTRGLGRGSRPAIVRVGAGGRIDVVPLVNIPFAKAALPNPPVQGARDEDGDPAFGRAITSLAVSHGAVWVAGLVNDEFSSQLRRVPLPFGGAVTTTGMRVYHTHHSRFETKSPVTALTPYASGGRDYLVVSYACTPLAIYPVDSLVDGARVTGRTIAELGAGTHATSMLAYEARGKRFLAVNTRGRSIQILEADDLAAAPALTQGDNAGRGNPLGSWFTWGVRAFSGGVPGILRLADFDARRAVGLQRNLDNGQVDLVMLTKPILWTGM